MGDTIPVVFVITLVSKREKKIERERLGEKERARARARARGKVRERKRESEREAGMREAGGRGKRGCSVCEG